jgi:hypothetical protein
MSRTKAIHVNDRFVWAWDNSHDIVVAHLIEAAVDTGHAQSRFIENWRIWASINDLGFSYPEPTTPQPDEMRLLLAMVKARVTELGDVTGEHLRAWSVLPGELVSGGFLRTPTLTTTALLDVVDAISCLIGRSLDADPPGARWFVGLNEGRTTIPMRRR